VASVALNLTGPYRLTVGLRKVLAASRAAGGASVVNLASLSAVRAVTLVPGYGAAKAGIVSLTHNLAVKWAPRNIRVNAVLPGMIDTPMTAIAQTVPEIIDPEIARIPMGRLGSPAEIASTIAFLCTEQSSYTSGALVIVDGASTSQWDVMTRALKAEDLYHTGIVVPDLDAAAERFSTIAGYSFTKAIAGPVTIRTDAGQQTVDFRFAYSLQAPHIELIEEVPGTPWVAAADNAVHHLGTSPTTSLRPPRPWRLRASPWSSVPRATTMRRRSSPTTYRRTAYASRSWTATSSATLTCS
jgi:Enoyl-(Acyl carrier protein) reductase/Glyoxalase/Bleomycin resistance protein/Dioxygenase superfamily